MLAERTGIDRALAYDVLAASAAGAPFVGYKRAAFVEPEATPVAFSLALADKDLRLITRARRRRRAWPMPQATVNLEVDPGRRAVERRGRRLLDASPSHLREEGRR